MQRMTKRGWVIVVIATVVIIGIATLLIKASSSDTKDNLAKCNQWQAAIDAKSAIKLTNSEIAMCEKRDFKMYNNGQ